MKTLLFGIECHDCEYLQELDDKGNLLPLDPDEPENRWGEIGPAPVIIKTATVSNDQELNDIVNELSKEYQVKTTSIITYELKG